VPDPDKLSQIDNKASHIFVDQQKWNLYKLVKVSHTPSYDSTGISIAKAYVKKEGQAKSPKLVASCFCARKPGYYYFNAYLIIFLITSLSLTVFSIDHRLPQNRLQTGFTLVLTSASFKWVINRSLPTVSYLTSLDRYAIICIIYLCVLCFWHSIAANSSWSEETAQRLDFYMLISFVIIFALIHFVFFIWFVRAYMLIRQLRIANEKFVKEIKRKEEINV
jgi:hypothetical protein